jgi:hypothetical protein
VSREHQIDGPARGGQRRVGEISLREHRRVTGRDQQRVTLAQGNLQPLGEVEDHVPAGLRAARLDKAQVTRRDVGLAGEVELTHAPPPAPLAQEVAHRADCRHHGPDDTARRGETPLPPK